MAKKKTTSKKSQTTVRKRITKQKKELIEALEKTPIPSYAVKKVGISKATYHRWRKSSFRFDQQVMEAIYHGSDVINDLAESKLIELVQDGNLKAITYWLKHHKREYLERRQIEFPALNPIRKPKKKQKEAIDRVFAMFEKVAREAAETYVVKDDDPDYVD